MLESQPFSVKLLSCRLEDSEKSLTVTPFEKNLEVWKQLWRVVERSDLLIQIVDARNPTLFRCPDLEEYVREVNPKKQLLILVNKSDFLSLEFRWVVFMLCCTAVSAHVAVVCLPQACLGQIL